MTAYNNAVDVGAVSGGGPRKAWLQRRGRGVASFLRYLVVGLVVCAVAQLVFWLRLGGDGVPVEPFFWAYSQVATIEVMIKSSSRTLYGVVWLLGYIALAALLWLALESWRKATSRISWTRPLVGWLLVEIGFGFLASVLLRQGILRME